MRPVAACLSLLVLAAPLSGQVATSAQPDSVQAGRFTVIGFGVAPLSAAAQQLRAIADAGGGAYLLARDAVELSRLILVALGGGVPYARGDTILLEIRGPGVASQTVIIDEFCNTTVPFIGVLPVSGLRGGEYEGRLRDALGRYGQDVAVRADWRPVAGAMRRPCM